MDKHCKDALRRIKQAQVFPDNTCPASRHTQIIGEYLAKGQPYPMLQDEPEHCAGSLLATVAALYEAREVGKEIRKLQSEILSWRNTVTDLAQEKLDSEKEVARLQADNERLRVALTEISMMRAEDMYRGDDDNAAAFIARAALAPTPQR